MSEPVSKNHRGMAVVSVAVVLLFAAANAMAWWWFAHDRGGRGDRLRIVSASILTHKRRPFAFHGVPVLRVMFNRDVAPAAGEAVPRGPRMTPALAGHWRWQNARDLIFQPTRPWPPATRFRLRWRTGRSLGPRTFAAPGGLRVAFHTRRLRFKSFTQVASVGASRYILAAEFNQPVIPAELAARLKASAGKNNNIRVAPYGRRVGRTVYIVVGPAPELAQRAGPIALTLRLSKGVTGTDGPLGLRKALTMQVTLQPALAATSAEGYTPTTGSPYVQITFNQPLTPWATHYRIGVQPPVKGAPLSVSPGGNEMDVRGAFIPGRRYSVSILPNPAAKPRGNAAPSMIVPHMLGETARQAAHPYPEPDTFVVDLPNRAAKVWFKQPTGYMDTDGHQATILNLMNVFDVHVLVTRLYHTQIVPWRNYSQNVESAGHVIARRVIKLPLNRNTLQRIRLSLKRLLKTRVVGPGTYKISVIPADGEGDAPITDDYPGNYDAVKCRMTVSDIGLTAKLAGRRLLVWATSLHTGLPMAGVRLRIYSNKGQLLGAGSTVANGIATMTLAVWRTGDAPQVIVADAAKSANNKIVDSTYLDLNKSALGIGRYPIGGRPYLSSGPRAFVYAARGIYRPGEKVTLYAIVRGKSGNTPGKFPLLWQLWRPDGQLFIQRATPLDANGMCEFQTQIPRYVPTGAWMASVGLAGATPNDATTFGHGKFLVNDFQPDQIREHMRLFQGAGPAPALGAKAAPSQASPVFALSGEPVRVAVQADYLFGQPAAGLQATLRVNLRPATFASAKFPGYTFGDAGDVRVTETGTQAVGTMMRPSAIKLDKRGRGEWTAHTRGALRKIADPRALRQRWQCVATATVHDTGGRTVSDTHTAIMDGCPYHIGVRVGQPHGATRMRFSVVLATDRGDLANRATALHLRLYHEVWNTSEQERNGRLYFTTTRQLMPVGKMPPPLRVVAGRAKGFVTVPSGGTYVLAARGPNSRMFTSVEFYAGGPQGWQSTVSRADPESLQILVLPPRARIAPLRQAVVDRNAAPAKKYFFRPGRRARVVVDSPFSGTLLLTVETDKIQYIHVQVMKGRRVSVMVPVTKADLPNAYITASVVRAIDPNAKWAAHRAFGIADLRMRHNRQRLFAHITAPMRMRPNRTLPITVLVLDARGRAVKNAAVTVAAVDKGICQLTAYKSPDPFKYFTSRCALGVTWYDLFDSLLPEEPRGAAAVGGDFGQSYAQHLSPIFAQRIRPVAFASRILRTDARGMARVSFAVPQFLGALRVMAVAADGDRYGSSKASVLVRSRLIVRAHWPRFAAPTDRFLVPVTIINNTKRAGNVNVSLVDVDQGPKGAMLRLGTARKRAYAFRVPVASRGQKTIYVSMGAAGPGVCGVETRVALHGHAFSSMIHLAVRPANPRVARFGETVVHPGRIAAITAPGGFLPGTARFKLRLSTSPPLHLMNGLAYLTNYPYGCAEQTVSRCLPQLYLRGLLAGGAGSAWSKQAAGRRIGQAMLRLCGMQTADGGVAMWTGQRRAWPWGSVYAAHFTTLARNAGFHVPVGLRLGLLRYLRRLLVASGNGSADLETQAYACYVLALAGKPSRAAMDRLAEILETPMASAKKLSGERWTEARCFLASALVVSGQGARALPLLPSAMPTFAFRPEQRGTLESPVREQAVLLQALLSSRTHARRARRLANILADEGGHKQWRSTQDIAFAVMALGQYRARYGRAASYTSAEFKNVAGETIASTKTFVPLALSPKAIKALLRGPESAGGAFKLTALVSGPPKCVAFAQWRESGVPLGRVPPANHGLAVRREYYTVAGKPVAQGTVRSGQLIIVRITARASFTVPNIVIDDLLPAGLQVEDSNLKTRAAAGAAKVASLSGMRIDARDDRVIITGRLAKGGATLSYLARATNAGIYVIPPIHGEAMYDRSINSIGAGGVLTVLPANPAMRRRFKRAIGKAVK